MAAIAGCYESDSTTADSGGGSDTSGASTEIDDSGDFGSWPMVRYNAANRLSVPHSGLDGKPEILWTADLDGVVESPVVYDDTAFVSHGDGFYTAINLSDGDTVWQHDTTGWTAPAVSDAAVYVTGDGVEALDHDTGDVLWTTGHEERVGTLRVYDGNVYAGIGDTVVVLDPDGKELQKFETAATVQALAIDDDYIYVRSASEEAEDMFSVAAYDSESNDSLWEHNVIDGTQWADDRFTRSFPVINGTVYTIDNDTIVSIDSSSGELTDLADIGTPSWTRPTIVNNTIYVRSQEPTAYNLESGDEITDWEVEKNTKEPFVVTKDTAYAARGTGSTSPQNLMSVDLESGDVNWEIQVPELSNNHMPVVLDGLILLPINDPGMIAFK
ncbi:hypothetical protein GCM10028856_04690 [Halopiger thermotolerans]